MSPDIARCLPVGEIHPQLRTTGLKIIANNTNKNSNSLECFLSAKYRSLDLAYK